MTIATHWPQPTDILRYYGMSLDAIDSLKREALASLGLSCADLAPPASALRFAGETDVLEAVQRLRAELDHEVVLTLVAAFEAQLQVDFQGRIARKQRDNVSRQFRNLWYARSRRACWPEK